jgi:hypothetical protein
MYTLVIFGSQEPKPATDWKAFTTMFVRYAFPEALTRCDLRCFILAVFGLLDRSAQPHPPDRLGSCELVMFHHVTLSSQH